MLLLFPAACHAAPTRIEAENWSRQFGSLGKDYKAAASGGQVLGLEWGDVPGDWAEYDFTAAQTLTPARLTIRYARAFTGSGRLDATLDGAPAGFVVYDYTGGWGDTAGQFRTTALDLPVLSAGPHTLRVTVAATGEPLPAITIAPERVLDLVGGRADKNSVGHGRNVALYTGSPSQCFFATHRLGNVFSATDGRTLRWFPDQVVVAVGGATASPNVNLDYLEYDVVPPAIATEATADTIVEQRQVCVTRDDVIVTRVWLANPETTPQTHTLIVTGDCRNSYDWRGSTGGVKETRRDGDVVLMFDHNVYPEFVPAGLCLAIGGSAAPSQVVVSTPGAYSLTYEISVPAASTRSVVLACAIDTQETRAREHLAAVLDDSDPLAANRAEWSDFYAHQVPRFACSDAGLTELYAFRWFLLRFSTAGGDLGYFKYPVVMEGRQAYQTYCCYSAPFMAFDMNWAVDPAVGFGHMATMAEAAYDDGRFPWYTSPRTNHVPIDHASGTGLSLLPYAAWKYFIVHGDRARLAELYPVMKRNVEWWLADRDPNGDGLFDVQHQLETGMDDLFRWGSAYADTRYDAVDATSYACMNLRAVATMARELGETADATRFGAAADLAAAALRTLLWNTTRSAFFDRRKSDSALAVNYPTITMFYPLLADAGQAPQRAVISAYLLDPNRFWLPYPVPALPKDHPQFNPTSFWTGPSWPAANSHVVEALARTAKRDDRTLLPQAAELFRRAAANHLQPRADFYERYNPLTGAGLSSFRDYMHSWWVDIYVRHVAGLEYVDGALLTVDPLPLGLDYFELRGAPWRGRRVDVLWRDPNGVPEGDPNAPAYRPGLTVQVDGRTVARRPAFRPGDTPVTAPALLGDLNCDSLVNNGDIDVFVLALTSPLEYATRYPDCQLLNGDANADGVFNNGDIDAFVALLVGG
jgi:hypothetical protein